MGEGILRKEWPQAQEEFHTRQNESQEVENRTSKGQPVELFSAQQGCDQQKRQQKSASSQTHKSDQRVVDRDKEEHHRPEHQNAGPVIQLAKERISGRIHEILKLSRVEPNNRCIKNEMRERI